MHHSIYADLIDLLLRKNKLSSNEIAEASEHDVTKLQETFSFLKRAGLLEQDDNLQLMRLGYPPLKPLSEGIFLQQLAELPESKPERVHVLLTTNSTNLYLKQQAIQSKLPMFCISEHQSAGRGRRGKQWISPVGCNLYFSVRLEINLPHEKLGLLSVLAGLSIISVLENMAFTGLSLKWPNDVYCRGQKLAGVLIEALSIKKDQAELIIGIGVNIKMPRSHSTSIDQQWTDLSQHQEVEEFCRSEFAASIYENLISRLRQMENGDFSALSKEWPKYDFLFGKQVMIQSGTSKQQGVAQGIDENGHLLIKQNNQLLGLNAGEVSVKPR